MRKAIKTLLLFVGLTSFLALSSCGTSSLPERSSLAVFGTLTDENFQPLMAMIIDAKSGSETETVEDGTFNFLVDASKNTLQLIVILVNNQQASLTISDVPSGQDFRTTLRFNRSTNMITTDDPNEPQGPDGTPALPNEDPELIEKDPPTPVSNFDDQGNTTSFGIPAGLVGNIGEGRQQWRNRCQECHPVTQNGRGYSFRRIKRAIESPPMNLSLPERVLADITAYLNR